MKLLIDQFNFITMTSCQPGLDALTIGHSGLVNLHIIFQMSPVLVEALSPAMIGVQRNRLVILVILVSRSTQAMGLLTILWEITGFNSQCFLIVYFPSRVLSGDSPCPKSCSYVKGISSKVNG